MDKFKKIAVFAVVGIIALLIIATLVFAIMGWTEAFMACAWSIVIVPCLIYAMLLIYKLFKRNN